MAILWAVSATGYKRTFDTGCVCARAPTAMPQSACRRQSPRLWCVMLWCCVTLQLPCSANIVVRSEPRKLSFDWSNVTVTRSPSDLCRRTERVRSVVPVKARVRAVSLCNCHDTAAT
jgi:hypothetical protein